MIARIWPGAVRAQDASAYAEYVQRTGIEGYKGTAGNRGAWLVWRGARSVSPPVCRGQKWALSSSSSRARSLSLG